MSSVKFWCFTLNNPTELEINVVESFIISNCSFGIFGKERGVEETPHLQGYFILSRRNRLSYVKARCSQRAHYEPAKGSPRANIEYCSKSDGSPFTHGDPPSLSNQRERRSRDEVAVEFRDSVRRGVDGLDEWIESNPGSYFFSGHNLLRNYVAGVRPVSRPDIRCLWIWGPPGVGKSKKAHEVLPGAYIKEPRTKWWSGYLFEREVIIDDFGPQGIDINHLLRWFDRYKCLVETKGGMCALYADNFIVTSNFPPDKCFSFMGEPHAQLPALMRRITVEEMM